MIRRLDHIAPSSRGEFPTGERCFISELLNNAGVADVSVARARVEPGVTTELHRLDCDETYIIEKGAGLMRGGDGQAFPVGPGDSVDIPAGTPQAITNTGDDDLVFLCVCRPRFLPEHYHALS